MPRSGFAVVLLLVLLAVGIVLLWRSIKAERRLRHSSPIALPSPQETENETYNTAPPLLPALRPKIVPVRYGKLPSQTFSGLIIANDGEPAYEVSIPPVHVGSSILEVEGRRARLTKDDGEIYCKVWIRRDDRSTTTGNDLLAEMIFEKLTDISVQINYKDNDNRRYATECKLNRDVSVKGGIEVQFVGQTTTGIELVKPVSPDIPDVFLEWALPNPDFPGISKDKEIIVVNRSAADYAYNVQIAPITLSTTLRFAKITEIRPQGRIPASVTAEDLENPEYQPFVRFFMNPENDRIAHERGFIKENPKGFARYSTCLPLTLTYSGKSGTCTAEILMEFDNWNGATFELIRRR